VTAYAEEIESDLSVLHRIDDMHSQPAKRMLRLARHLPAYQGAVRSQMLKKQQPAAPAHPDGVEWVPADRNSIRNSPLADVLSC
jgi:hypothetical protein